MSLGSAKLDAALDRYLTTPPEPEESHCKCVECLEELYPGDDAYDIDGDLYCEEHGKEWLEQHRITITESMAYV